MCKLLAVGPRINLIPRSMIASAHKCSAAETNNSSRVAQGKCRSSAFVPPKCSNSGGKKGKSCETTQMSMHESTWRDGAKDTKGRVKGSKRRPAASNPYDNAVGTPIYMSPEHICGQPYDREADVWAFGCTLFETMSLSPPWADLDDGWGGIEGGMDGLMKHLTSSSLDISPLKEFYSESLCLLLGGLLKRQISDRISLDVFLTQLSRLRVIMEISTTSTGLPATMDAPPVSEFHSVQMTQPREPGFHRASDVG